MNRSLKNVVIAALSVMSAFIVMPGSAAILTINGIAPFDQNLGTLTSVQVRIDPDPITTSVYTPSFDNVSNHNHTNFTPSVSVAGLDTYTFPQTSTSFSNAGFNQDHDHIVDLPAITVGYSGGTAFNWFLDSNNPTYNTLIIQGHSVLANENHDHTVPPQNVVPRTTFIYTVPEPTTFVLLGLSAALVARRHRFR